MSGGSFNYLCHQIDACGHLDLADLEAMRDRLQELAPDSSATEVTARLYDAITAPVTEALTDVWRAVEWFDSGDYGQDQVDAALRRYDEAKEAAA